MNVQDYILSGIVESCVLGLASPEERAEFERMCAAHPDVRDARDRFEQQLEITLLAQKVNPPPGLKSRIFSHISMEKVGQSPVVPMGKPVLLPRSTFLKYVAAASLVLLAGSILLNLYLVDQYKKSIAQYKELVASQTQVASANQVLQAKLKNYENAMSLMKDPLMAVVKLPGAPGSPAPASMATVYWNKESKDVYLLVNQLPKPLSDKEYQLWAIVDGKMVDAGVFDILEGPSFVKLKRIPKAEGFAVTLEKGEVVKHPPGLPFMSWVWLRVSSLSSRSMHFRRRIKQVLSKSLPARIWTIFIFILLALPGSMLPNENHLSIPNLDKYVHVILFGSFVFLWSLYYALRTDANRNAAKQFLRILAIACLYGIAMEYVQKYFIPNRDFDLFDIAADIAGATAGYIFVLSTVNWIRKE